MPGASWLGLRNAANSGWPEKLRKWQEVHWRWSTAARAKPRPRWSTWHFAHSRFGWAEATFASRLPKKAWALWVRRPAPEGSWQRWQRRFDAPERGWWHSWQRASKVAWGLMSEPGDTGFRQPTTCRSRSSTRSPEPAT